MQMEPQKRDFDMFKLAVLFCFFQLSCASNPDVQPHSSLVPSNEDSNRIKNWFEDEATHCDADKLHHCSAWRYLSTEQFDELVLDGTSKLNPAIRDGAKIFELGVGVGAALHSIGKWHTGLILGGNDLAVNAIKRAKEIFPTQKDRFFVQDMTLRNESIPDNTFDHVLSFGALGMYLTKSQMLQATKEAVRITKPGGSLLFTSLIRPGGKQVGSIVEAVEDAFWVNHAAELGIENVRIYNMKHQGDRYQVAFRKKIL